MLSSKPCFHLQYYRSIFRLGISLRVLLCTIAVVLLVSYIGSALTVRASEHEMRSELLKDARVAAAVLDFRSVKALTGTPEDVGTPSYNHLYHILLSEKNLNDNISDIYLLDYRRPGSKVIFLLDTDTTLADPILPGTELDNISHELIASFTNGRAFVEGPMPDAWGNWVSALVPISDPRTGEVLAVLGVDTDARRWVHKIIFIRLSCFLGLAALLSLLFALLWSIRRSRHFKTQFALSQTRYRDLFNHIQEAVFLHEPTGTFLTMNPTGERLFGYTQIELSKLRLADLLLDQEKVDPLAELQQSAKQGTRYILRELTVTTKRGEHLIIELYLRLVSALGMPEDGPIILQMKTWL